MTTHYVEADYRGPHTTLCLTSKLLFDSAGKRKYREKEGGGINIGKKINER